MRYPLGVLVLGLMLLPAVGSADETSSSLPPPECRGRDGQIPPEAKDPVPIAGSNERPIAISTPMPRPPNRPKDCPDPPRIWVQAVVTTQGKVCASRLLLLVPEACSAYAERAVDAVRKWTFKPLVRDGAPVAFLYYVGIGFQSGRQAPP
jgi:hypothetical protein